MARTTVLTRDADDCFGFTLALDSGFQHRIKAVGEGYPLRGRLIARIAGPRTTVVAEHLPAPARVANEGRLLDDLQAAGFQPQGWGWPLHEPLFAAVRQAGAPLVGGNLPKGASKQLMMKGRDALDAPLADVYRRAPLAANAVRLLDADLVSGHCGKLPEKYLAPMRLVQRATDIDWSELAGIRSLGVTAGASAPEVLVQEVIEAAGQRFSTRVEEVATAVEDVHFNLPRALAG